MWGSVTRGNTVSYLFRCFVVAASSSRNRGEGGEEGRGGESERWLEGGHGFVEKSREEQRGRSKLEQRPLSF